MWWVLTVLGVRDIVRNKVGTVCELKELQINTMRQNTKVTFLRGLESVKVRWRKSPIPNFHLKNV